MCKLCKFLFRLIPLKIFQSLLIKKHFSICSRCQKEVEMDNQLEKLLTLPVWIKKEENLWPKIKEDLYFLERDEDLVERKKISFFLKKCRWAAASLVLVVLIGLSLMIRFNFLKKTSREEAIVKDNPRVLIKRSEIKGKKARPYIYQTPDISYIWFSEIKNSGG